MATKSVKEASKVKRKADLAGDKEKSFARKFDDFIRQFPTEQQGLDAYAALPD